MCRLYGFLATESTRLECSLVEAHNALQLQSDRDGRGVRNADGWGISAPVLTAMMGAVLFLLLLTCVNVASILLASAAARERAMAIRTSLGSPRSALVRLFLIETGILSLVGGAVGIGIGAIALRGLVLIAPATLSRRDEIALSYDAILLGAGAALLIAIVLGIATALPFTRPRVDQVVSGSRTGGGTPGRTRARGVLVAIEVALAVVILTGAGVLLRSVQQLAARDLGADPTGVLTFDVGLPNARYENVEAERAFHALFHERLAALPGVVSVAATSGLPVTGSFNTSGGRPAIAIGEPVDMDNIQVTQG